MSKAYGLPLTLACALGGCQGPPGGGGIPGRALPASQADGRFFPDTAPWYADVSAAPVSPQSGAITSWMVGHQPPGGWGTGTLRIDFSLIAVDVPAGTPRRGYERTAGYYSTPDCDTADVPLPPGGAVEGSDGGYGCDGFSRGDDCHILLASRPEGRLYEIYHATVDADDRFQAGCLAIWDTSRVSPDGRGEQCTSADAAGFPIAPLLFTPEEVQAGRIDHALRFILPNDMIQKRLYVAPATHGTSTTGPATSGPYGFRMRLRGDYPLSGLAPAARVVARAMQTHGILLADGGSIALTAQSDVLSAVKWADVGLDSHALAGLKATDFEVLGFGSPTSVTDDCRRAQVAQ